MRIITGDFSDRRVDDFLDTHLCTARAETAPGSAHALAITAFQSPDITFWTIWDDQMLVGFGALERFSNHHGELKSMHTTQAMRRMGVGSVMLRHSLPRGEQQVCRASASTEHGDQVCRWTLLKMIGEHNVTLRVVGLRIENPAPVGRN
jgi:hypothetical protein